ncbi:MAG: acetoin utilization deacetylase AcuC-like enzyme [Kiritimatiellia bacterium]|jgi:acetoin utilization deacetylase AcuC-like enzyme
MKKTGLVINDACRKHDTGDGHPESIARYDAVMEHLRGRAWFDQLDVRESPIEPTKHPERCHDPAYVALVGREVTSGRQQLSTGDTLISKGSLSAAHAAVNAGILAVDQVVEGEWNNAFCVVRPPGHHARPAQGMGFCLFNNIGIAARYAQEQHAMGKVLIVDWDVHHGNGTQDIFYEDESVYYFSTHQSPWYPGTGDKAETGTGKGRGTTLNAPFPAGAGRKEILGAFQDRLSEAMEQYQPELVMISAGFDSRVSDPLGQFRLEDDDFGELTTIVQALADQHAEGRLISMLEGGYNLQGLSKAAGTHVKTLLDPA